MVNKKHWVVIGSGFRGLIGAYLLAKKGHEVTIIDKSQKIGGVLSSEQWKSFYLDKGCHLFDNDEDDITSLFLEIMDDEVQPVNVNYASFLNHQRTDGIAIPDLSTFGDKSSSKILWELLNADEHQASDANLKDKYSHRFGDASAKIIDGLLKKTHLCTCDEIDSYAFDLLPFKRIKFTSDPIGKILKKNPFFDSRVAVSSADDMMQFYKNTGSSYPSRNFYPMKNGLGYFCTKVEKKLREMGVNFLLGHSITNITGDDSCVRVSLEEHETISADYLLWAGSQELLAKSFGVDSNLGEYVYGVPMSLFYFVLDESNLSNYSYVHNFDSDTYIYRASAPFNYGNQSGPEGKVFVCCEVPTSMESEIYKNPKGFVGTIWDELRTMEFVKGDTYDDFLALSIPTSYKIPLKGYKQELDNVLGAINRSRLIGLEEWEFSKNNIVRTLNKVLTEVGV